MKSSRRHRAGGLIRVLAFLILSLAALRMAPSNATTGIEVKSSRAALDKELLLATGNGYVNCMRELIKGANISDIGSSLLEVAASHGQSDEVEFLLSKGVNANVKYRGRPVLTSAVTNYKGEPKVVKLLIAKGAELEETDSSGRTALIEASGHGNIEIVDLLIAAGANVNAISGLLYDGDTETPLLAATKRDSVEIIESLIAAGADVNLASTIRNDTALHFAGESNSVRSLLKHGARVNARNQQGDTPLHAAMNSIGWNWKTVTLLLKNGAAIEAKNNTGHTPLHIIAAGDYYSGGDTVMAKILLVRGADVNAAARFYDEPSNVTATVTPLYLAARNAEVDIVKLLLFYNATVNVTTSKGDTPLLLAVVSGHQDVVHVLLEAGADPNKIGKDARNGQWTTTSAPPLYYAVSGGHLEIAKELIARGANVNSTSGSANNSILVAAVQNGHKNANDIALLLLAHGADPRHANANGATALHHASRWGLVDVASSLLIKGADPNARMHCDDENPFTKIPPSVTPLMLAARHGHGHSQLSLVRLLMEHGAIVNATDYLSASPLAMAVAHHRLNVVRFLVERGVNVREKSKRDGWMALHWAAHYGDVNITNYLLAHGGQRDINARDKHGRTPLHIAANNGHRAVVDTLLAHGANVNARTKPAGETPLHLAVRADYAGVIRSLLASNSTEKNALNSEGTSSLHLAVQYRRDDIIKLLVPSGTKVDTRDYRDGAKMNVTVSWKPSPHHKAAHEGNDKLVAVLLKNGTGTDARDEDGSTALHKAAGSGNLEEVESLIKAGADVNAGDLNRTTPLHKALLHNNTKVVNKLLEKGASVNAKEHYSNEPDPKTPASNTPLHIAARSNDSDTVSTLLASGADINAKDLQGNTPLHTAVMKGHDGNVRELIDQGADVNLANGRGLTPLMIAANASETSMAQALLKAGADPTLKDMKGNTALHRAASLHWGNEEIVEMLLRDAGNSTNLNSSNLLNARNHDGDTPFDIAASMGNFNVVEFLVRVEVAGTVVHLESSKASLFCNCPQCTQASYAAVPSDDFHMPLAITKNQCK